jgi:ABC-type nitrate/sulfonate/bicarbonate transport system ATPase subunit
MTHAAPRMPGGAAFEAAGLAEAGLGIEIDAVTHRFRGGGGRETRCGLSLSAAPRTFTALLGPSGCGKTTALRLVDGLIAPDSGSVRVFGRPPKPGPEIGLVFQSCRLIPWATVRANLAFWTERRPVVLFVTHSVDEAILLADRVALFSSGPGRVVEVLDVDPERPRWAYDARAEPRFVELRRYLSDRMRGLVLSDPASEFFGRDLGSPGPR